MGNSKPLAKAPSTAGFLSDVQSPFLYVLAAICLGGVSCDDSKPVGKSNDAMEQSRQDRPRELGRTQLRRELRKSRDSPSQLSAMLDLVLESGLLNTDEEVRLAYASHLASFDATTLAKLANSKVADFGGCIIPKLLAQSNDLGLLRDYYTALGSGTSAKEILMQTLGADSPLFAPDSIGASIGAFTKLSTRERQELASGLKSRIRYERNPDAARTAVNAYLAACSSVPEMQARIVSAAVSIMETDEAQKWLLSVPDEIARVGDRQFMIDLNPEAYSKGFDFINSLIEHGYLARAQGATEQFLFRYATQQPRAAAEWVVGLDAEFVTPQMLTTAFVALNRTNPALATSMLEQVPEPKRRRLRRILDGSSR